MLLSFNVEKQIITRTDTEKVVTNSMNYLYAQFSFSDEWTGEKTAVFKGKHGTYNAILDAENKCLVPWEILTEAMFDVSVFCGDLITANAVKIFTIQSGYEIGDESRIPTPEIYTQVINKLNEIEAEVDPEAIERTVDEYLADKEIVTEDDVETIVSRYISDIHGIPTGGTTGQVLTKKSGTDYDTEWKDASGGVTPQDVEDAISAVNGIIASNFKPITAPIENKYINNNAGWLADSPSSTLMQFDVVEGEVYRVTGSYRYNVAIYGLYNSNDRLITTYPNDGVSRSRLVTETKTITIPAGVAILRACSFREPLLVEKLTDGFMSVDFGGNILYGKKWCVCGDSFTAGDFTGYVDADGNTGTDSDAYDPITGHWKTYPWWISQRNKINVQWLAEAGNDFTNISGATRPFSNAGTTSCNYTQIATNCDYITIAFGLNEYDLTTAQIGTKTDTTNETLWGAYNVVLEDILTANPAVKIGIIITDSWLSQTYHDALVEIAEYWGIPYLDLRNGKQVPMMINGRLSEVSTTAKALRDSAFLIEGHTHPNVIGHEYRSTVIENFLRSL